MKFLTRKVKVLGKSVPVFALVLILMTGIATAALLTYYGKITGSATVTQGLLVDGKSWDDTTTIPYSDSLTSLESKTVSSGNHQLQNTAGVNAIVKLNTACRATKTPNSCDKVETKIVGELTLTKKNVCSGTDTNLDCWNFIGSPVTIEYTIVGNTFEVSGVPAGYVAVYYPNKNSYDYYDGVVVRAENVGSNLPIVEDLNGGASSNYCTNGQNPGVTQCVGAKIWLVPTDAITDNVIDWSKASNFYFETELIQYNSDGKITVYPTEVLDFTIESDFPALAIPATYTLTTTVLPVTA